MHWMPMADGMYAALAGAGGWLAVVARAAAPVAISALWQGAAIAFALWVCLGLMQRVNIGSVIGSVIGAGTGIGNSIGAAQRFAVWAAAFAVVAGLPLLPWLARGTADAIAAKAPLGAGTPRAWFEFDDRWAMAIGAVWLAASLVRAVRLVRHALHLRRIWNAATPVTVDAKLHDLLAAASPAHRPVELCTTRELDRPSVIGFLAPRILIPDWLFERLTPGELEQIVLHEAEHLRRGDDWTNLLQKLVLVLFPLNPALAWIERRLCREREMACDEGVVRRTQAPHAYAACLASLAERGLERRRAHALSLGAFERRPELVRRVYSILARPTALHPAAARALVGVAGCGLLFASVELARCPQMVAFVPAAQTATLAMQETQATAANAKGDRAFVPGTAARGESGLRAVETKAILPARRDAAALTRASLRHEAAPSGDPESAAQRRGASIDGTAPREVLLRAETPDADAGVNRQPEYVVLTAWEEVQSAPRDTRIVSDYDAGAAVPPQSGNGVKQTDRPRTMEIMVTRVIFAVYPIEARPTGARPASPAAGAKPAHAQDPGRLTAPQPQSGWLVLQL